MEEIQKHIRCKYGDIGKYVLTPGDQGRAKRISERLDNVREVSANRGYFVYTGRLDTVPVSVCSTGIGGPSTSIAIEELAKVGGKYFIRVGSAGGRQKNIPIGSIVVATSAFRGEGTSQAYIPLGFPAVASLKVTNALIEATKHLGYDSYIGTVFTRDAYYVQDKFLNQLLTKYGIVASEQECSISFILGSIYKLHVGSVLVTDSNIWLEKQPTLAEKETLFKIGEKKAVDVAIEAVKILIAKEKERY
ncbi:MAG TPA: purine phosphorylase [Candidatus Atribacteria bacterium]|jgi:uridine phosphorylase|nr:purine phosphorylase [Candidatus Atribacteria bacterium]